MKIFNAKSQQVEETTMQVDHNNEIVATFADGSVVKFPSGLTEKQFADAIAKHQEANEGQQVITEDDLKLQAKLRANSEKLIGNTMPEGQSNGDSNPS